MDHSDHNTYVLITSLIEKHLKKCRLESGSKSVVAKKLRSRAFEVLLKKRPHDGNALTSSDVVCNLLAWQFSVKEQPERCAAVKKIVKQLQDSTLLSDEIFKKSATFLLHLQGSVPDIDHIFLKSESGLRLGALNVVKSELKIRPTLKISSPQVFLGFGTEQFSAKPNFLTKRTGPKDACEFIPIESEREILKIDLNDDEGLDWIEITPDDLERKFYNWEYLDNLHIKKELPFMCEAGPRVVNLFQKIVTAYTCKFTSCSDIKTISADDFVKNIKNMLIGIPSEIFYMNEERFCFKSVSIEGISAAALKSYCSDLLFAGTCFRSLSELCTTYTTGRSCGYIFKEMCESIKRYLTFYRVAILSLPNTTSLLTLHKSVSKMNDQIAVFSRICKVGPFVSEIHSLPQSTDLLTYLYEEVINVTDKDLALVLFSVFYPCCQIYFHKFLQRWLFEGVLVDSYEEFFIKSDANYTNNRSRSYWTKHFSLKQIPLPDFLAELKSNILLCGKSMNLLKLCKPESGLCKSTIDPSSPLLNCCLTSEQLKNSKEVISSYYVETAALCSPRLSLLQKFREREEEERLFLSKVQQKQALTLRRIELQRQKEAEEKVAKKRKIFEDLKEQMRLAEAYKKKEREEELQNDLLIAQRNAELEEKKLSLLKHETYNIVRYYDELFQVIDNRRVSIEKRKEHLESLIENQTKKLDQIKIERDDNEIFYDCIETKSDLDLINANLNETFEAAKRNKAKVMNLEFGVKITKNETKCIEATDDNKNLTDAQRNKLRVMRSEYQIYLENDNMASPGQETVMNAMHRNNILALPKHLERLDFDQTDICNVKNRLNIENDAVPMSIGSTPNTDTALDLVTPSTSRLFIDTEMVLDSARTIDTSNSIFNDDGFKFPILQQPVKPILTQPTKMLSKSDVNNVFNCNTNHLLSQSIFVPLEAQLKLVNNELLKYFLNDHRFFSHLHSLRCYFFLLDGEFGRHITEGLFNKLYEVKRPHDLLNGRCLQIIMTRALCASSKVHENSELLSFCIEEIPTKFDLSSADVLDCLSMSYKVTWPLNILLPSETIEKYQHVFKYLLKLHHISWILQKIFQVRNENIVGNFRMCGVEGVYKGGGRIRC